MGTIQVILDSELHDNFKEIIAVENVLNPEGKVSQRGKLLELVGEYCKEKNAEYKSFISKMKKSQEEGKKKELKTK